VTQDSKCIGGTSDGNVCTVDTDCAGTCIRGGNPGASCTTNTTCTGGGLCDKGVCKNKPITDVRKWHHVAGKYIAGQSLRIFVDGRLAAVQLTGVPASIHDSTQPLYIGTKFGSLALDTYFNGVIDNVSVWNRAKTGNEIFNDAHMEVSGWAKAISSEEGGWLSLRGHTRGDKVWGAYLKDYLGFYTLGGFMGERSNNERVSTTNLVGHWKFNEHTLEGTVDEVVDGSGSNNHGVAQGGLTTIDKGIFSRAGEFDGTNDYVNVGSGTSIDNLFNGGGTIEAWIKWSGTGGGTTYKVLISKWAGWYIYLDDILGNDADIAFTHLFTTTQGRWNTASRVTLANSWNHIAMVYNGSSSNNNPTMYVNGISQAITTTAAPAGSIDGDAAASLILGNLDAVNHAEFGYGGQIDNVSIYNRIKTAAEISADYERRKPYSAGWGDFDDDPPAPVAFNTLTTDSSVSCTQMLVQWEPSTWADSYSYWREQQSSTTCDACSNSSGCTASGYTENSYLDTCSLTECSLSDTGLSENTGYCYSVEAHNETGDTFITDSPTSNPAPKWKSTTLCPVSIGMSIDTSVCGQITITWDAVSNADGYNPYRALTSTGCDTSINTSGCEAVGHIGESLDYDANNDGTTDLVGHWKFNESSGTTVVDSSGSLNTGTATDADTTNATGTDFDTPPSVETTALFSNARHFDGTDDYIDLPHVFSPANVSSTDFTVELWFNVDALGKTTDQNILTQEDGTGTGRQWLLINDSGNAGATNDAIVSFLGGAYTDSTVVPVAGSWYYAALTKSGTTIKIYISGELKVTGTQTTEASDGGLRLGLSQANTDAFDGVIDNVSIYNVAKTPEQIRLDYEAGDCGGADCGVDSTGVVCHQVNVNDGLCGKVQADATACCFTDKRIIPFTNYHYKLTATNEAGESNGSSTTLSGQTKCYPAPEAGEE
ncbi:LamG domain-containing protein, partial [Patescibacteria group bacterium AH-259-L07]|nr:LamG domain-containing protein [Patescibacteria group bacterium AH-259-L07]